MKKLLIKEIKSNVAKSEQNLTKFQKIYMYTMYTYIRL